MKNDTYVEELRVALKKHGFKLTHQRRNIVEVLIENRGSHLKSEEIYDIAKNRCPEMGLATIYRTLQVLDGLGYINKLNLDDGVVRYELNLDVQSHNHHHLVCNNCGKIIEVEEDLLEVIEKTISNKYDFRIINHELKFVGLCEGCKK